MGNIYSIIEQKTEYWINAEKRRSQSIIGQLIKHIEKTGKLREPQLRAIEAYLWLKFVGQNQRLSEIIRKGLLYDDETAKTYNNYRNFRNNFTAQFLNQFFQDNNAKGLHRELVNDPAGEKIDWNKFLDDLLHNYAYPNYLFSLPMGAGKTYLMACFIYLDLYFSSLYPADKRFAHNFIVLAPTASKTAIIPSLSTIKNFDVEWILPKNIAQKIKQGITIEMLDALSSKRKDKLQGNNPNLEKANRLLQTKDRGLVFITNAEKVILERYDDKDKLIVNSFAKGQVSLFDHRKLAEIVKLNELRERLSEIPYLSVILDEVHHLYGKDNQDKDKKTREAVNILNQHGNVVNVLGLSGTPYVKHVVEVGSDKINLNQIQDIVYNYPLNEGIGRFLKIPDIKSAYVKEKAFIKNALSDFFANYDFAYTNGTKSKMAVYCPSIKVLNEDIYRAILEWYKENRQGMENEIFRFYTNGKKENKQYELPKESNAIFNNLDKPYSDKRIVLLVAIGTEGWDCKSLAAVSLPRQKTTKNFVLQTTCRCLREVENAKMEKALVYLEKENYATLDHELKENYNLRISDLKISPEDTIAVKIRKPKLGKISYRQVYASYKIITKKQISPKDKLGEFDFKAIRKKFQYDDKVRQGQIGSAGLIMETYQSAYHSEEVKTYAWGEFLYDLSKAMYGKYSETELLRDFEDELRAVYGAIKNDLDWISANPNLNLRGMASQIAALFMQEMEFEIKTITEDMEIELLEWTAAEPRIAMWNANGDMYKFMPKMDREMMRSYRRHPEDLEEDFFTPGKSIDPYDSSFNYIPYRFDSDFERNALAEMLKLEEMAGLEVYFNNYKDSKLQSFHIETPRGVYTPDFLVIRRKNREKYQAKDKKGDIEKILIVETKGSIYYDDEFRQKEKFIKEEFKKHNPNFEYTCFVDAEGKNDFRIFLDELRTKIKSL